MDIKEIKAVIDLMRKNSLAEFEYEKDGTKIRIRRGPNGEPQIFTTSHPSAPPLQSLPQPQSSQSPTAPTPTPAPVLLPSINSPMVGTFYAAPAPDSPAYVDVGTVVNAETVVCIIEAMKVMNEIKAELSGTITEILAESGKPVEFGKPLFRIRPT
jgi:acetyl-CoA carboxylase biotin carboxyl carrier protein